MTAPHQNRKRQTSSFAMFRLLVLIGIFADIAVLVQGCTCVGGTFEGRYASSPTVVKAQVINIAASPTPKPSPCNTFPCFGVILDQPIIYTLKVLDILKGCGPENRFFFTETNLRPGFCGFGLSLGETYMLNLDKERPVSGHESRSFNVNSCQGNRLFSSLSYDELNFLVESSSKAENQCRDAPIF